ncbi:tetratricopeptide repeat protein [Polaribacter sp. Hel1_85]|uniref:ATP-binding protein n=1 Tax=Polaribacter sp. Hel1_85 TaxID=1250005 RepID=UPI00052C3611|nr:tetratricopeptide repeat protein [Polaribacter sp. Hel1_85]KGL59120.1 two-component system sensor histidine kinase [Polaribacter sp. Hel1_85]
MKRKKRIQKRRASIISLSTEQSSGFIIFTENKAFFMRNLFNLLKMCPFQMTFIFYLFFSVHIFGQNMTVIDSLISVLETQKDTIKIKTLNELAWEYRKADSKKAALYARNAKTMSDSLSYLDGTLTSLNRLGAIAIYQKNIKEAEELYLKILKKEIKRNNVYGIARTYNQLGLIYTEKGEFSKALTHTLKAEEKFKLLNKTNIIAITSNNIGDLYRRLGNYRQAMQYLLKSLNIKEKSGNKEAIALTLQNIGIFQIDLQNYKKALDYLKKSEIIFEDINDQYELSKTYNNIGLSFFSLKEHEKALKYYNQSIEIKKRLNLKEKDNSIYNNLGTIYHKKVLLNLALFNYKKALEIKKNANIYNNIAHIYFQKNDYNQASIFYKKALNEAEISNQRFERMVTLDNLSDIYSKLKNYSLAIHYNEFYLELRDSLENDYKSAMSLKMNYEEKRQQVQLLEKDKEITKISLEKKEIENWRKTILIYSLLVGLVLVSLLFFAILKGNRQKQLTKLAEKNQQIEQQKVEELLKKQELKSMNAMMVGQEEERKRIARDLHDRLGSMLAMVKNHFKSVEIDIDGLKSSNTKLYNKANKLLDEACEEVRKISQDMASGVLTKFGLTAVLEDLKETLEESKQLEVEFISHGLNDRLPLELEISIYRIIQELISNILKHAKASEISIQLLKGKQRLNIIVEDNGIGFKNNSTHLGMGLKNIDARIDGLHGDFKIDSTLEKGTTITIDIPLKNNKYD